MNTKKHNSTPTRYKRHTARVSAGMSYIEAIVWVAVFSSAMIALVTSILYFYRTSNYAIEQASAVASAQHGIDLMVRTIREASYASNGAYPVVSMSASDFVFYSNINHNDVLVQRVHFYMQGTTLMQGVIQPSGDPAAYTGAETVTVIAPFVQNIAIATTTFSYFDANGAQIVDYSRVGSVRFVTVNVVADLNPNNQPQQLTLRSSTALRNLIGH